jgi:hypothetical protein
MTYDDPDDDDADLPKNVKEAVPPRFWSFVTGSRKYGEPRPDSDIDLVVMVGSADLQRIREAFAAAYPDQAAAIWQNASDGGPKRGSFRFGNLNLICVTDSKSFNVWRNGTSGLFARMQRTGVAVMREYAVQRFREWRKKYGVECGEPLDA